MTATVAPHAQDHARARVGRRAGRRPALLLACALAAVLGCAGPALAAPGLTPLGGPEIGLPTGDQRVGAVAVHRGAAHAAVIEENGNHVRLQVQGYDRTGDAWVPVAGPLNNVGSTWVSNVALLSTGGGELYVAWIEHNRTGSSRAVVARLAPDGRGWERIMQTPMSRHERVRLAQVGEQAWVAWNDGGGVRLARIAAGHVDALPTDTLPAGALLGDLVGYGAATYITYTQQVHVAAHRDNETGHQIPADIFARLRVARLTPVPDRAGAQLTEIGSWNDVEGSFLTAGTPDAPARPILAWNGPRGIEVMRLRADGNGFDRIPIAPLITLRRIRTLRGIATTPAGITIAATSGPDANVRIYTLTGTPSDLKITAGDPLAHVADNQYVTMVPAPASANPGALILGYDQAQPWRAAAMCYTP